MHRAGAGVYLVYEFLNVAVEAAKHKGAFFSLTCPGIVFAIYFYTLAYCRLLTVNYLHHRNTASTGSCTANNINLNILANYISFLGQPSIKECAFNELTELIY